MNKKVKKSIYKVSFKLVETHQEGSTGTVHETVRIEAQDELSARILATTKVKAKPVYKNYSCTLTGTEKVK